MIILDTNRTNNTKTNELEFNRKINRGFNDYLNGNSNSKEFFEQFKKYCVNKTNSK